MSFKKIVTDTFIQFLFLKISPMTDILVLDFSLAFIKYLFPATTRGFAIIIVNAIDIIAIIESTIPEVISFKLKYFIASEILNTYPWLPEVKNRFQTVRLYLLLLKFLHNFPVHQCLPAFWYPPGPEYCGR